MRFFRDMRIGARLGLGFSILILLSVMAAGIGIERLNTVRSIADRLGTEDAETVVLTQQWVQAIDSNAARTWVVFFAKDPAIVARVHKGRVAIDPRCLLDGEADIVVLRVTELLDRETP